MQTTNVSLERWVHEVAELTKAAEIKLCDGSDAEYQEMIGLMLDSGLLHELNDDYENCYLHRSDPTDVARVEHLTFVCTPHRDEAGPNNNWMEPDEARAKMEALYDGCMEGRTMYVIPYCMGPIDSPYARLGIEITDSPYVVANMKLMTRMGEKALHRIEQDGRFVRGLHSTGDLNPERRFIMHFPEEMMIQSFGSGYGGNALLGKKCHALRIASWQARDEGWLAEHMLLMEVESPEGKKYYLAAAFPSACGKTNLAMLEPPESQAGWKIRTLGDDIAWLHVDDHGQMRAINPEAGYFGVVPGTNEDTNRTAFEMIQHNAIFTNVAVTADNKPWWEEKNVGEPAIDWQGKPYKAGNGPAAHPNSRFTVAATNNSKYSPLSDDPAGVPITAIIFGGRRRELAPLVYEAKDWNHGVLIGASVASETTAAAIGKVGVVRRDPMAMKPFCGYNFAQYWGHWLGFSEKFDNLPPIYHVNWFRRDDDGRFLWPGFGENLRVLRWIIERCEGRAHAVDTPIGALPLPEDIDTSGLDLQEGDLEALLSVDNDKWREEFTAIEEYFDSFEEHLPDALRVEHKKVVNALS